MRLRIRTVLRYPWPDSWGAFSGRSGFCFRASAIAVIFLVFCFQRLVREFSPDVSANTLFRTYVYVWDKNFKLCGAADSGSQPCHRLRAQHRLRGCASCVLRLLRLSKRLRCDASLRVNRPPLPRPPSHLSLLCLLYSCAHVHSHERAFARLNPPANNKK